MNKQPIPINVIRRLAVAATVFSVLLAIMNLLGEKTLYTLVELGFTVVSTVLIWVCYFLARKRENEK